MAGGKEAVMQKGFSNVEDLGMEILAGDEDVDDARVGESGDISDEEWKMRNDNIWGQRERPLGERAWVVRNERCWRWKMRN